MKIEISSLGFLFPILNFIFGTVVGSFLNVVIYRLPRNESIINPPSHCPSCGKRLAWYDLVPILSFIILRGKCRYCGAKISLKYPLIEAITGLTFVLIGLKTGFSINFPFYLLFASTLISIAFIDLFEGVVPDAVVILGIIVGLLFNLVEGKAAFLSSLVGIALALVFFGLIILISKGGMGEGDLTLSIMIGAFLGWQFSLITFVLAFIIGAIGGVIALIFLKKNRKDSIPFGPYLSLSAFIVLLYGYQILDLYFRVLHF